MPVSGHLSFNCVLKLKRVLYGTQDNLYLIQFNLIFCCSPSRKGFNSSEFWTTTTPPWWTLVVSDCYTTPLGRTLVVSGCYTTPPWRTLVVSDCYTTPPLADTRGQWLLQEECLLNWTVQRVLPSFLIAGATLIKLVSDKATYISFIYLLVRFVRYVTHVQQVQS